LDAQQLNAVEIDLCEIVCFQAGAADVDDLVAKVEPFDVSTFGGMP
jgi:hypothetical protein